MARPVTETLSRSLPIEPDFDRDHTALWSDRIAPGISPVPYQRYTPPVSRAVCVEQIEALTDVIASIATNMEMRRQEANTLAEQGLDCNEVQNGLRRASDAKRKYESARSAFLYWLKLDEADHAEDQAVQQPAAPVAPSVDRRVVLLAQAVRQLAETYQADLNEQIELHEASAAVDHVLTLLHGLEDQP